MTFDSLTFAIFLIVLLAVYSATRGWASRKAELLVASYVFYAGWSPPYVLLLAASTAIDWHVARRISTAKTPRSRRAWLVLSLVANLGLLAYFKYGDFLLENMIELLAAVGVDYRYPRLDLVLPVGISFYTFQTLSYTIDVYRQRVAPSASPLDYALYVSFFPQLVAGPIVRYEQFADQCRSKRIVRLGDVECGIALLMFGLFLKVVLADSLFAAVADAGFAAPTELSAAKAWTAILAFSGQIYCDFAGYSLCAIGAARLFGFRLPQNFRAPYASVGFSDFWRRWHITLSSWLRDYLYVPLGGSRHGRVRTIWNLLVTMGLGGLWHGASWTFVLWGLLHGAYLVGERLLRRAGANLPSLRDRRLWPLYALATFAAISLAWVLFRADSLASAHSMYRALFAFGAVAMAPLSSYESMVLGTMALVLLGHGWARNRPLGEMYRSVPWLGRSFIIALLAALVVLSPGESRTFIYFQF